MSEDILVECSVCGDYLEITNQKPVTYHDIQTGVTLVVKPCKCTINPLPEEHDE